MINLSVKSSLFSFLSSYMPIDTQTVEYFNQIAIKKTYSENQLLLSQGEVCTSVYLVEKGVCRSFRAAKFGIEEQTTWLANENRIITSPQSLLTGQVSDVAIQTLEESVVWEINFEQLKSLQQNNLVVANLSLQIAYNYILRLDGLNNDRRGLSIQDNIAWFDRNFKGMAARIKCKHVASFLGTSQSALSRAKRVIREKARTKKVDHGQVRS